jgi:hypothetical protein
MKRSVICIQWSALLGLSVSRLANSRLPHGHNISLDLLAAQDRLTLMIKQLLEYSDLVPRRDLVSLADERLNHTSNAANADWLLASSRDTF